MIITRKIELWLSEDDNELRKAKWSYLKELNDEVYRAANFIVNNQYFNEILENRVIMQDTRLIDIDSEIRKLYKSREKNKEKIDELKKIKKIRYQEAKNFYQTSKQNVTYQLTSREFPNIPANIVTSLNASIIKTLKTEWNEIKSGKRAVRNYRKGMPIPFNFSSSQKWFENKGEDIFLNWLGGLKFKLFFGRDKSNNRAIVERAINKEYKYADSSIQLKDKKIFLLFVVDIPYEKANLNKNIAAGVDLGIAFPAFCALSEGYSRLSIGNKEDLLKVRLQMQSRRKRLQKALKITSGGKGRTKKLKALESLTNKEKNYVTTYNHKVSYQVIKFAKDNKAGIIKLEFLEGFGEDEKNKFILRNWSFYQLQKMIEYKAKREGIEVLYIDPYHTSQTCAICGNYEEGQREKQEDFICKNPECKNFEKIVNADYNAALNIAKSNKIVSSSEQCEYNKKHENNVL